MTIYEYGHIRTLARELARAGVDPEIAAKILAGGEDVRKTATPAKKAEWLKCAMDRMDDLLDPKTRRAVREGCACCLGGKRLEISKRICKENASLEDRIAAANDARFVFGHAVSMQADSRILVEFAPPGLEKYGCVCLRGANEPVSITYCYCCGGHAKHHLQIALGRRLELEVRSSALASAGSEPCTFLFRILDTTNN